MWVLAAEVEAEGAIGRVRLLPAGYRRRTGRAMGAVTTGCCSCAIEPDRGDGPEAGLAAGFEGLDDDHAPAAAGASIPVFVVATIFGVITRRARRSWLGYGEEPAGQCNVVGPAGIGEEAVVTDAMKSVGQDMDQEAADELVGIERHKLIASVALGSVILPFERDARAVEGDETAVGNSNSVRVAGQVGEHSAGSAKRPLGIDHPFDLAQCGEACLEGCRLGEGGLVGKELQPPGLVGCGQSFQEQAAEEAREHRDGEEEARSTGNPEPAVERDAAARYDDMGVRMMCERRSPAVQHGGEPDARA